MNARQLAKLGIPSECMKEAIIAIQRAHAAGAAHDIKNVLVDVLNTPDKYAENDIFGDLARKVLEEKSYVRPAPITYKVWGVDIDEGSHNQMKQACAIPGAVAAALMPDAHVGYGLPIGGVLGTKGKLIPYAVGVDIGCSMQMTLLDMPVETLQSKFNLYKEALERGTRFGIGDKGRSVFPQPKNHEVMDDPDWSLTKVTAREKDKAHRQLGTSGSGNHFVEFGVFTINSQTLGIPPNQYVALLSHSGSRGAGSAVCNTYSAIAQAKLPSRFADLGRLAWLDLDSEEGQEYWLAMNLMGRYASANHQVIHKSVSKLLGAEVIYTAHNQHNLAWKEMHNGEELIVHRKGATPAAKGVIGIIPGSMGTPAFLVMGKGNPESLNSASHGAGRAMSRNAAKEKFSWKAVKNDLEKKGIIVLAADADEVPGVYKDIRVVMEQQRDLVDVLGQFDPKIVLMCGDGSKSED